MLIPEFNQKYAEDLERIRQLCLMDDDFMTVVFEDIPCAELLLQVILERDDLSVREVKSQVELKNPYGRSVRLDIQSIDEAGRLYNIEVQRKDEGAIPRRARYNSSLIDIHMTKAGEGYTDLNETYVIFITEHDVLKRNLPIYHIDRVIRETDDLFDDGSHIIYVNGQIKNDTALGRLMHDFFCKDADEMYNPILANRVRYFKEEEKGVDRMSGVLEEMRQEVARKSKLEGIEEGIEKGKRELAQQQTYDLLAQNMSYEKIAGFVRVLSVAEIQAIDKSRLS